MPSASDADQSEGVTITWLGHATTLVEHPDHRVLTDPALTRRLAHLVRRVPEPDTAPVHTVLVSHLHMDHLHRPSLRRVAKGAAVTAPAGAGPLLDGIGAAAVEEVTAGELSRHTRRADRGVEVAAVPAAHHAGRGPQSRRRAEPLGYLIRIGCLSVYFAGDTDLFAGMGDLGPVDVALLPIWGWGRTLGEQHLNPSTAALATEMIQPRLVIPVHWGTYSPMSPRRGSPPWLGTPLDRFRYELAGRGLADRLVALAPGQAVSVPPVLPPCSHRSVNLGRDLDLAPRGLSGDASARVRGGTGHRGGAG